jgi:exonuclease SbcD
VLLVGNHDMPGALGRATAAEIYEVLRIPGVYVARDVSLITVETRSGPLQVVAVPWITRSMALVNENLRQLADADLDEAIRSAISYQVRALASRLDRSLPSVLLAHVSLQGADFGLERSLMLGRDVRIGADDLEASAFDFVALGHIHKHQTLGVRPPVVYAGSPERVDFGEEGEDKGFVLVDICQEGESRRTEWEFVELPARRFETLRIDATGSDPLAIVEREVESLRQRIRDSVVRAFITVDADQESSVSVGRIRRMIAVCEPFAVAGIRIETEDRRRLRMELELSDALDQTRMLERWIASRGYDAQQTELVRSLGNELIARQRERDDES